MTYKRDTKFDEPYLIPESSKAGKETATRLTEVDHAKDKSVETRNEQEDSEEKAPTP